MTLKSWDNLPLQLQRNVKKLYAHLVENTDDVLDDWDELDGITRRSKVHLWNEISTKLTDIPSWKELSYKQKLSRKLRWEILYNEIAIPQRTISFTVNDGTDAIQGAKVSIGKKKGTTGSNGGCTLSSIGDGDHIVEVTADGYEDYSDTITTASGATSFTISLTAVTDDDS